jgi:hypothetical protein
VAVIILVHGIAQEQSGADALEATWLPALASGVRAAGFPIIADRFWRERPTPNGIDTRMAFYGDLFLRPGQQGLDPGPLSDVEAALAEQLVEVWLGRAAERASQPREKLTAARELAATRGSLGTAQGPGEVVRLSLKSLAKLRFFAPYGMAFAETFVNRSLAQLTRYLTDQSIRSTAQDRVKSLIGPETKVVIGHSLGSIVAYEAAQQLSAPLPLLITLGSPLGLDTIVYPRLRPQPPGFPMLVQRWVNVADRDDFISAETNLTNLFNTGIPDGAVFEGGYTVDNGAQPHRADFYLSKVEVGRPIGATLNVVADERPHNEKNE